MSISLPARACRYYAKGVCIYAESMNPGFEASFCCTLMAALMRDWDDFLDRAEAFSLSEEQVRQIWGTLAGKKLSKPAHCPHKGRATGTQSLTASGDFVNCPYLSGSACLLSLPRCEGRCEHFSAR